MCCLPLPGQLLLCEGSVWVCGVLFGLLCCSTKTFHPWLGFLTKAVVGLWWHHAVTSTAFFLSLTAVAQVGSQQHISVHMHTLLVLSAKSLGLIHLGRLPAFACSLLLPLLLLLLLVLLQ